MLRTVNTSSPLTPNSRLFYGNSRRLSVSFGPDNVHFGNSLNSHNYSPSVKQIQQERIAQSGRRWPYIGRLPDERPIADFSLPELKASFFSVRKSTLPKAADSTRLNELVKGYDEKYQDLAPLLKVICIAELLAPNGVEDVTCTMTQIPQELTDFDTYQRAMAFAIETMNTARYNTDRPFLIVVSLLAHTLKGLQQSRFGQDFATPMSTRLLDAVKQLHPADALYLYENVDRFGVKVPDELALALLDRILPQ